MGHEGPVMTTKLDEEDLSEKFFFVFLYFPPFFPFQKRVLSQERDLISLHIYKYTYVFF